MLRYVLRRFLTAIPTLFVIVTISFFLMRVAPGGPFNQEKGLNPVIKANLERVFHLDQPLWKQYLLYLNNLIHGDFGPSYNLPDFTVAELFAAPSHPYTEGLLAAIPKLGQDTERLHTIAGSVPLPTALPSGCTFRDRCPYAFERCATEEPALVQVGSAHRARCHLIEEPSRRATRHAVATP